MTHNIFSHIAHNKIADQAVEHIEKLILEGILRFGDRLPSERDLSNLLNISRPVLRNAIKTLEEDGLLTTRPGGGTFVADITGQVFTDPVVKLIGRHPKATMDYLEYRRSMEGIAAELAAKRATPADKDLLTNISIAMVDAHALADHEKESLLDIELHNAIGECAHNVILLHSLRSCYRLLADGVIFNRMMIYDIPHAREKLLEQHQAIIAAINLNDPNQARKAAETHIDYVIEGFKEAQLLKEREHISSLRLQQRTS
jgi:GntR family transcriptional repressor for pyruvate dehydrogenase complex